jgi:S-methylmethionine-dependent homocysteine/selenocysteine methylase
LVEAWHVYVIAFVFGFMEGGGDRLRVWRSELQGTLDTLLKFITDGGLETTLVFHEKIELPCFAAFILLKGAGGRKVLRNYYRTYAQLAVRFGAGFVFESPTWRANPDWATKLGYSPAELEAANRDAIRLMHEVLAECETPDSPMVISGCVGPRGDGYQVGALMSPEESAHYHEPQLRTYLDAGADLVSAITMTYPAEAIGIANAAAALGVPAVISFTLETDGRLPSGQTLRAAIQTVDAQADKAPAYYMINCAHRRISPRLAADAPWIAAHRGPESECLCRSHAELDASPDLDAGDRQLGRNITNTANCCLARHPGGCWWEPAHRSDLRSLRRQRPEFK